MTEATNGVGPAPRLEQLLGEQARDWMRGRCEPVSAYLARQPALAGDAEAKIELIHQEIILRLKKGETPRLEDYLAKYPDLAKPVSEILQLHSAVSLPTQFVPAPSTPVNADGANGFAPDRGLPIIPGYKIERVLGSGGMAVVYLAHDLVLKRWVALKILHRGAQDDPAHRGRFEREAAAAAKCQHPNLVQIFEIGEHHGAFYLALEYVDGGTLAKAMAGAPQPARSAAALAEKLARAIDHVHGRGIVHRDLKPANVMLTAAGEPKITDFGLARLDDGTLRTEVGTLLGTLAYMAPEQASGGTIEVGALADIHALGAILYEALTGRAPYRSNTPETTLKRILFEDVVSPSSLRPDIPRDLETICLKCLQKEPAKRYTSADELSDDLRRFADGRPITARPLQVWERSWRWCRRNPKLAALTALLAASVLIAAIGLQVLSYRHNKELRAEISLTQTKEAEARRNYQEARSTIRAMIARLDDPRRAGVPQLLDLTRDQMDDALAFYDHILTRPDSSDETVRADYGRALVEVSVMQLNLGRDERAENLVRRALGLIEKLREDHPDDPDYLKLHFDCLIKTAAIAGARRGHDQGLKIWREALQLADRVTRAKADDPSSQELVAMCHVGCGRALVGLSQKSDALTQFESATRIRQAIDPTKLPGVTNRLAESLIDEGVVHWNLRDNRRAEERFRRAEDLLTQGVNETRSLRREALATLGSLNVNWGGMLYLTGRFDEAIARVDQGLTRVETYLHDEPNDLSVREICLQLHGNRGYALMGQGKHRESAGEWARVIELSPQPVPPDYRIKLGVALACAGDYVSALSQAELVQLSPEVSSDDCYNLGCLYSRSAQSLRSDKQVPAGQRAPLEESLVSNSLRWLKSAQEKGFFENPGAREHAKEDSDLSILAEREEFRRLVEPAQTRR
jgi:eukaryotic-like serine/threonine-protein kinase